MLKSALVGLMLSMAVFVGAVFWGAYFAFPEPDASAAKAAQIQLHSTISGWLMILAICGFLGSCITLLAALINRARGKDSVH